MVARSVPKRDIEFDMSRLKDEGLSALLAFSVAALMFVGEAADDFTSSLPCRRAWSLENIVCKTDVNVKNTSRGLNTYPGGGLNTLWCRYWIRPTQCRE